ncbi:enoyl-CoA hydratase/isomerase family protein [Sphingomonas canadensis]|uniref:Enoyl-CoA hydratase/isomerase family protein n=1 Tax=Sphingomonas canadensis TaxID=1219257 RepID=A0ABW3H8Y4_9SPHN|nr:enoyl-CoA hydratase/isomerase family protein [Sphingomonas canadensis]MCW3836711.1 enoyl-CoA hydratase/isomerase family protein [Sphingomonas canadensis]
MISVTRDGPVAIIALARPEARNAMPTAAWLALADAAAQVADARAVILRSDVPRIFSAGADVREFEQLQTDPAMRGAFRRAMRAGIDAIAALPMPVIAAVDGGCFGAAVALILAADVRIAGNYSEFAITPGRLGLGYPREDVARLAAQVGKGMASLLLFTGDKLRPDEAYRIGLIELKARKADDVATAMARAVAGNAPNALRLLKATLADPANPAHDQAFEDAYGGAEFAEGVSAFRERRPAVYP